MRAFGGVDGGGGRLGGEERARDKGGAGKEVDAGGGAWVAFDADEAGGGRDEVEGELGGEVGEAGYEGGDVGFDLGVADGFEVDATKSLLSAQFCSRQNVC